MYNDLYGTFSTESFSDAAFASTAMMGLFSGIIIFSLILSLISIISCWKIFSKAGKPGWASIVPIYSNVVMLEIAKLPIWNIILYLIPIANIYILFKVNIEIAKKFGKSSGFGIGMSLIPIIFVPLLAFSDNVYEGNNTSDVNANSNSFDATNVINNNVGSSNINMENTDNVIQQNIPTDNIIEPTNVVNETVENVMIEPEISIPTMPVQEPQVDNVEVTPELVAPAVESTVLDTQIEPVTIVAPEIEPQNVEITEETVIPTIEPEVVAVEETNNDIPNAFNSTPIITEPVTNIVPETLETTLNSEVQINNVVSESAPAEISEETVKENLEQVSVLKKLCKNCGNELPEIVSICPSCGTDNE